MQDLWTNKGRTLITAFSMACGMSVLAGVLSVVEGQKTEVHLLLLEAGGVNTTKVILRSPSHVSSTGVNWLSLLNWVDQGIREEEGAMVKIAVPDLDVRGVTPTYTHFGAVDVVEGRFLCDWDEVSRARVAVVGDSIASRFGQDTVGSTLQIAGQPFEIVGRLSSKANLSHFILGTISAWKDHLVLIPFSLAVEGFPDTIQIAELYVATDAKGEPLLPLPVSQETDCLIVHNRDSIQYDSAIERMMPGIWALILVSVFLACVGVVNIMTSGVTERVVDIGVRRALGASPSDMVAQFVVEAAICGLLGSVMGYIVSIACVRVIVDLTALPSSVTPWGIVLCFLVGPVAGMLAGFVPALRARRIHPAEALRAE